MPGPAESASTGALGGVWQRIGARPEDLTRALRGVNAWAPGFRQADR